MVKRLFIPVDDVVFDELERRKVGLGLRPDGKKHTWEDVVRLGLSMEVKCDVQRDSTD